MTIATTPKTEHPQWVSGDFELVSSDEVTFSVQSLLLQSISWVPPSCSTD